MNVELLLQLWIMREIRRLAKINFGFDRAIQYIANVIPDRFVMYFQLEMLF